MNQATSVYICEQNYTYTTQWVLYLFDSTSNSWNIVEILNNPTVYTTRVALRGNSLIYGIYKLVHLVTFNVSIYSGANINNIFNSTSETYINVIPTGIAVFGLANGNDRIIIGTQQSIDLNPVLYSFDMDYLVTTNVLKFKFYCQIIDWTLDYSNMTINDYFLMYNRTDLYKIKSQNDVEPDSCFVNNGICLYF